MWMVSGATPYILSLPFHLSNLLKEMCGLPVHVLPLLTSTSYGHIIVHSSASVLDMIVSLLFFGPKQVEAEEQPEISEVYSVSAVPYFVFFKVT